MHMPALLSLAAEYSPSRPLLLQVLMQCNADLLREAASSSTAAAAAAAAATSEPCDEAWFMEAVCCHDEPPSAEFPQT